MQLIHDIWQTMLSERHILSIAAILRQPLWIYRSLCLPDRPVELLEGLDIALPVLFYIVL